MANKSSLTPLFGQHGEIIGTTCIYYTLPPVDGAPDWHGRLKPVTEFIDGHYAEELTIERLAAMVNTSPANFRRLSTLTIGTSPGRYLTAIRLNAVRRLLETTDKLVSEIAAETGFWDQSHLTKIFKRERGVTPGEYRRRHRAASAANRAETTKHSAFR